MPHITHYMPELQEPERTSLQSLVGRMTHEQIQVFASAYRQRRKDPHTVLLTAIIDYWRCGESAVSSSINLYIIQASKSRRIRI